MYEPRTYRAAMGLDRFSSLQVRVRETDLWIGVDRDFFDDAEALEDDVSADAEAGQTESGNGGRQRKAVRQYLEEVIQKLREELLQAGSICPEFFSSMVPLSVDTDMFGPAARRLIEASERAGTGPMAGVAGLFSEIAGQAMQETFGCREVVVENGGDLYISIKQPLTLSVYAGETDLSNKILVTIPADASPLGVCTSSGTVGHSFSYGKADAVMTACRDTVLADAYATASANRIKSSDDLEGAAEELKQRGEILSAVMIVEGKASLYGDFKFSFAS